jgi:hypothetical protein
MSLEIQRHITGIYNELDQYHNNKGLNEICYWHSCKHFKYNEAFQVAFLQVEREIKSVTKNLAQLSESIDDVEICINRCKQLVLLEKGKDTKFAEVYNRYHAKLNGVVDETKIRNVQI